MVGHRAMCFGEDCPVDFAEFSEVSDQLAVAFLIEPLDGGPNGSSADVGRVRPERGCQHRQHRPIAGTCQRLPRFFESVQGGS
jgi:hypothetical protein